MQSPLAEESAWVMDGKRLASRYVLHVISARQMVLCCCPDKTGLY